MKFQIKLLTTAAMLAASASSFALSAPGDDLGVLTEVPALFGDYRPADIARAAFVPGPGDVFFGHTYGFSLASASTIIGSLDNAFFDGTVFSSVIIESLDPAFVTQTLSFAEVSNTGFKFEGLAAGSYLLTVEGIYPKGTRAYAGSVYALTPAVPEPESLALLLAGLGVAGVVVRRRQKA